MFVSLHYHSAAPEPGNTAIIVKSPNGNAKNFGPIGKNFVVFTERGPIWTEIPGSRQRPCYTRGNSDRAPVATGGSARTDDKGGFTMHVYAQANDAQDLIELGLAKTNPETTSRYPHLVSIHLIGNTNDWETMILPGDDLECVAYRISDPVHTGCGWLVSHEVVQWQPAGVWRALERWAQPKPEAVAL